MRPHTPHHDTPEADDLAPSRSQRRRDALAVLELAEALVALPPARLDAFGLPEDVRAEIDNVRRITAHVARKRQLAYLAKLMRRHGEEAFAEARAGLSHDRDHQRRETATLHRFEALRERLLGEGDAALTELLARHPHADRQHLRALIRQARAEREQNKPLHAYRELFRALRELSSDAD